MRWLLSLLLFLPLSASAGVLRICNMGDTQRGVQCDNATTAWAHLEASVDGIVANPEQCDVVIWPGDIVDGYGWNKAGDVNWVDCWCLAQATPTVDCTEYENPITGRTCYSTECDDTEAIACAGGTAGHYCEHTRVQGLLAKLAGADVPYIVLAGNHDTDDHTATNAKEDFAVYNSYFGKGHQSGGFKETGVIETTLPYDGVEYEQADASYHVLNAGSADWLFLALPWVNGEYDDYDSGSDQPGMSNAVLAWALDVIDAHPKMPTIVMTHAMVSNDCDDAEQASYEDVWCAPWSGASWDNRHAGKPVYDSMMMAYPQVFMTIGSHIRELFYAVSASTPHRVLGAAADYTNALGGSFPAWQTTANGGGGAVTLWRIDTVLGSISSKAWSDEESEWVDVYGNEGSNWSVLMPLCDDDVRFSFPAEACPQPSVVPQINLGRIRNR